MRLLMACFLLLSFYSSQCGDVVPVAVREESVTYRNGTTELGAALLLPERVRRAPGVVILQGSGESDRNNAWARAIATSMAERGIVVLLTDKRKEWKEAGFDELAHDALAGVALLRTRAEVDRRRVGLVGLSQGGHIAPLAASLSRDVAFVVDVSGAATTPTEQVNHEMRNTFKQAGLSDADVERGMEIQRLAGEYIRKGSWQPYRAALDAASQTNLAPIAKGFPQTEDSWVWRFWRKVGEFDPMVHWQTLPQPALVIYGADDENDNVPVAESVRRLAKTKVTVKVFEGSGHALYAPGKRELREDFVELLATWVKAQV